MKNSVYEFNSTRTFLMAATTAGGKRTGIKAELAKAARCHPAFVSRVLAGQAQLSLEQAERVAAFLRLTSEERRYFLFLLQEERAGTEELRAFFRDEREAMIRKRQEIRSRIPKAERISVKHQAVYYSAWYYAAIHTLVSVNEYRTVEAMARALNLPIAVVREAVNFLESIEVLSKRGGKIEVGQRHIHLDRSSPLLKQHHVNWRMQSVQRLDQADSDDLRYSGVFSLSHQDASRLRETMLRHLKEYLETISRSPEEGVYAYCFDFFGLVK